MGDRVERGGRSLPSWLLRRSPDPNRRTLALAAGLGYLGELALSQLWGETRFDTIVPAWIVALVTLPAFVAALWRYAHPWPVFIVALVQTVAFAIIFPDSLPMLAVLLGLHAIARQRPLRDSLIALACLVLAIVVATPIAVDMSLNESLGDAFFYLAGTVVIYAAAGVVVVLLGHSQQVTATLQATRAQVYDAIIEVRLQEDRLRLARDLHDKVANSIAAVTLGLDGIRRIQPDLPAPAPDTLDLNTESSQKAMQETREIVTVLRGEDGEDEPELEGLESTLMQMQAAGMGRRRRRCDEHRGVGAAIPRHGRVRHPMRAGRGDERRELRDLLGGGRGRLA